MKARNRFRLYGRLIKSCRQTGKENNPEHMGYSEMDKKLDKEFFLF
jgi:hypothetical protein